MNAILGGPFLAPWDIEQIPEDQMQAIMALENINELQRGLAEIEERHAAFGREHGDGRK